MTLSTRRRKRSQASRAGTRHVQEICAPGEGKLGFTCYSPEVLTRLTSQWNAANRKDPIQASSWLDLYTELRRRHPRCDKESCLLGGDVRTKQTIFAPTMQASWKKNKNEWLDSNDILKVMKQYERAVPEFEFLGPSPSDFDAKDGPGCVWDELCKFSLRDWLKRGKTKFGVIFNIDPHTSTGSHWVTMFINANTRTIYFFNSTGQRITTRIGRFKDLVQKQSAALFGRPYKFKQNAPVEHQFKDTECGVYSLFFVVMMIQFSDNPSMFAQIFRNKKFKISDKEMEQFRTVFFNRN